MKSKPKVNLNRKFQTMTILDEVEDILEFRKVDVLDEIARDIDREVSLLKENYELHTEPYFNLNYPGYDGGVSINVRAVFYTETEEEWKLRVEQEKQALVLWEKQEAEVAAEKYLRQATIQELEEKIKELKGGIQ